MTGYENTPYEQMSHEKAGEEAAKAIIPGMLKLFAVMGVLLFAAWCVDVVLITVQDSYYAVLPYWPF